MNWCKIEQNKQQQNRLYTYIHHLSIIITIDSHLYKEQLGLQTHASGQFWTGIWPSAFFGVKIFPVVAFVPKAMGGEVESKESGEGGRGGGRNLTDTRKRNFRDWQQEGHWRLHNTNNHARNSPRMHATDYNSQALQTSHNNNKHKQRSHLHTWQQTHITTRMHTAPSQHASNSSVDHSAILNNVCLKDTTKTRHLEKMIRYLSSGASC